MILVDTSIWIDHLRRGLPPLVRLLEEGSVLGHPWVAGEIALGRLRDRTQVLGLLGNLPPSTVATPDEIRFLIDEHDLTGAGIGYVDAQLLASTRLTAGARLWSADQHLAVVASRLGLAAGIPGGHDPSEGL